MPFRPLDDRIVLRHIEAEAKTKGGILIVKESGVMGVIEGAVA